MTAAASSAIACGGCDRPVETIPLSPGPLVVEVTGDDYEWHVRYPGADGRLHTDDDILTSKHLHVPSDRTTRLELRSEDYLYTFAIPRLGLNEIAVPDLEFALEIPAGAPATHELRGDQLCGFKHESLMGTVVVEPPDRLERWLATIAEDGG